MYWFPFQYKPIIQLKAKMSKNFCWKLQNMLFYFIKGFFFFHQRFTFKLQKVRIVKFLNPHLVCICEIICLFFFFMAKNGICSLIFFFSFFVLFCFSSLCWMISDKAILSWKTNIFSALLFYYWMLYDMWNSSDMVFIQVYLLCS